MSTAPSSQSRSGDSAESRKERLHRLVELLSDDERQHVLHLLDDTVTGERFWEGDFGLLYNEYAKMRFFRVGRQAPTAPALDRDGFVPVGVTKSYPGVPRVPLPDPPDVPALVGETLRKRRSRRSYTGAAIPLGQLSALLGHACGVTATVPAYGFERLPLRAFPSHGGLMSPEVYAWTAATGGLQDGLYHYEPRSHSLELLAPGDHRPRLQEVAFGEDFVMRAGAILLITMVYDRLRWKYGDRAYRFACMDAGFLGENLYLTAEALGFGACAISGFAQDAAEGLLGVDGKHELVLLLFTVGVRNEDGS